MKQVSPFDFPARFFWGAATAAHQVEGGNHNQWSVWELEHAKAAASQAKYQFGELPNWSEIKSEATDPNNYVSGKAADHYNRYEEDFQIAKDLHMNAFRFSIEWSRIEPEEGVWNAEAIEHYRQYLRALRARKLEPFVTMWHWTMPLWFAQKGGFEKRANVSYFVRFVEKVLNELGKDFRYIITINEPEVYIAQSYIEGNWPPMVQNKATALRVYMNLAVAHNNVYRLAKETSRKYLVGLAKHTVYMYPGDDAIISKWSAKIAAWGADDFFLDRTKKHMDFLGLNYYFSARFYGYRIHNPDQRFSDTGDDLNPSDIQHVLERHWEKYKLPIIVTENGLADQHDKNRKWWITQTLIAMDRAMKNGVRLEGYLHWSLLDNFEWSKGFWPKFGLVAVDRKTQKRTVRPSAVWLAGVLKSLSKRQ